MSGSTTRGTTVFVALVTLTLAGGAVAGTAVAQDSSEIRLVHASPDAPPVDVYVDGEAVVEDLQFGNATDYLALEPGMHNITITEAGNPDNVVFQQDLPVQEGQFTIAAAGELDGERAFEPVLLIDDAQPAENESLVRVVHLAPDAPAVDVTVANSDTVLAEDVSFGNATVYEAVPPGEYTLEIREATPDNDGTVVDTVNVSVEEGQAYTAVATGYLAPEEAPGDEPFQVVVLEDQTDA